MTAPTGEQMGQALAVLRIGAGIGAWLTPNLAARVMGLPPSPALAFVVRLFGIRDLMMGAGYLAASPDDRGVWLRTGMVADAADAVAALTAVARNGAPARTGVPLTLTALAAAAAGNAARRSA